MAGGAVSFECTHTVHGPIVSQAQARVMLFTVPNCMYTQNFVTPLLDPGAPPANVANAVKDAAAAAWFLARCGGTAGLARRIENGPNAAREQESQTIMNEVQSSNLVANLSESNAASLSMPDANDTVDLELSTISVAHLQAEDRAADFPSPIIINTIRRLDQVRLCSKNILNSPCALIVGYAGIDFIRYARTTYGLNLNFLAGSHVSHIGDNIGCAYHSCS